MPTLIIFIFCDGMEKSLQLFQVENQKKRHHIFSSKQNTKYKYKCKYNTKTPKQIQLLL